MIRLPGKFVALKTTLSSFHLKITPSSIRNNHLQFDLPRFCYGSCHPFDEMPQRTQGHSSIGFFDVLDLVEICKIRPNIRNVVNVHALAVKVGVLAHLPTSTSLVMAYARAGHYRSSVEVFDEISYKDVITWNAMMTGSIENEQFGDAVSIFVEMLREGIKFDSITLVIAISAFSRITYRLAYLQAVHSFGLKEGLLSDCDLCNALINAYARHADLGSSERMFLETDFKDKISWNSMISGYLSNDHPEKSLRYFKKMVSCGKQVDNVGLSCAISASISLLNLGIGKIVHGLGIKLGYDKSPHVSVLNTLVSFYSKCGDIDAAYTIFNGIYAKNLVSWNTMINGFASNRMILEAFHLLNEMQLNGSVEPDTVTILSVLSLCAESMLLREGMAIHGTLQEDFPNWTRWRLTVL